MQCSATSTLVPQARQTRPSGFKLPLFKSNFNLLLSSFLSLDPITFFSMSIFRNALGVVLVYDITNHETFRNIPRRLEEARKHVDPESVIMLVGNKLDLRHLRTVDTGEGREYADQENISFIEASAADSTNVIDIFDSIINQMLIMSQKKPKTEDEAIPTVKLRREKKDEKMKKRLQKCCL